MNEVDKVNEVHQDKREPRVKRVVRVQVALAGPLGQLVHKESEALKGVLVVRGSVLLAHEVRGASRDLLEPPGNEGNLDQKVDRDQMDARVKLESGDLQVVLAKSEKSEDLELRV